jgi:uracil phosphoribosyltransferase
MLDLFPSAAVFHLGLFREKVSLQPVEYYQKLPPSPTVDVLYILDPLVATGGTAVAAVTMLVSDVSVAAGRGSLVLQADPFVLVRFFSLALSA